MKRHGILNSDISRVLSYMGHTDRICIGDCGLPIPDETERIDLAVKFGVPTFMDVLKEVGDDMKIEKIVLAEEIKEKSITVKIQAGVEGRVFGSISSKEIALEAKKQLNMDIDKKKIIIPDAIKSLGTYNVNIKLHKDVMATLAVKVEAK